MNTTHIKLDWQTAIDVNRSELQRLSLQAFEEKNITVYIKRDDLIHPVISGNKWRKLKFLLQFAIQNQIKRLVSFGGAYSNHLPALALAAKQHQLASAAFVRGDELNIYSNSRLQFAADCGMELIFVSREAYREKQKLFEMHYRDTENLFVDEGGKSKWAIAGCEEIVAEVTAQLPTFNHILLPVGTGATLAGVASGAKRHAPDACVHGIVTLKGAQYLNQEINQLLPDCDNYMLHHGFHHGGYAKKTPELLNLMQLFQMETHIATEYIYSGKMIYGLYELLAQGVFKEGEQVVIIHTGGLWPY